MSESEPALNPAPGAATRVIDGAKEYQIQTTRGCRFLLRALIANAGWYSGAKEFARRRRLAKAIGKDEAPKEPEAQATWDKEPCDFWLSDRLKEHARKCMTYFLDKGALAGSLDDEHLESLMIDLGIEMKDS